MNRESIPVLGPEPQAAVGALDEPWAAVRAPTRLLDGPCAVLSWALPLGVALWSLGGEAGFRDDLGIVRDLGLVRVGSEGVVSTLLTQAVALLPLGGRVLRASLVGALGLGLASRCLFGAVRAALDRRGGAASDPLLALLASSLWALGTTAQSEATRVGGALPAVALVLLGLGLGRVAFERVEAVALTGAGLVLGATLAESHAAGACLALGLACLAIVEPARSWRQGAWRLLAAAASAFLLLGSLRWFWPVSTPVWPLVEVVSPLTSLTPSAPELGEPRALLEVLAQAVALVAEEVGGVPLALALGGCAVAACLAPLRRAPAAWALPLALSAVVAAGLGVSLAATPLFTLLSSLGTLAFFPFALQALWAWGSPLPLARPAAVLSLVFASTLVLTRVDRALLEPPSQRGAAVWADEALGGLPPNSLLLVHSRALAFRLLASRTLHGTRPDVILVPAGLLSASSFTWDVPRSVPSAAPLLRQLWVNGVADEYSLSHLADERPVFVELAANWDRRLLEHLRPEGLWLGYSAAALRPSERRAAASRSRAALRRVFASAGVATPGDASGDAGVELHGDDAELGADGALALDRETRRALGDGLGRQALSVAALGEHDPARRLLRAARRIDPDNPLAAALAASLAEPTRGHVAAFELLE